MKRSSLNFLKPKSPNLFDTNVQIKHYDNVEFVLDSAAIPESGTAKVRSRPTVKHFSTSGDGVLGFAVPTPTVPVMAPPNGPQSYTGSTEKLSNGSMISVADPEEGEILIPAPPSVAPPPPPPQFIPPSPQYIPPPLQFFGDLDPPVDLAALQPPSMPPPKPPSISGSIGSEELDVASLKPPPMAPPKPPTDFPSSINAVQDIPECPKFTPPLPPVVKPQSPLPKAQKTPPPKPIRLSSINNLTELTSASTPAATPASSFNPQTTAKLYSVPKTTVLTGQGDRDTRTQHILLLEDTSGNPVGVHVNGKAPLPVKEVSPAQDVVPPVKPVRRNSSGVQLDKDVQDVLQALPNEPTKPDTAINENLANIVTSQEVPNKVQTPVNGSPKTERALAMAPIQEVSQVKELPASSSKTRSYSPLLNRKLHNLRGHEGSSVKETAASPLALLMAAKEREKQRSTLSRQSSNKSSSSAESMNVSIHPSETKPNSFTVTPTPISSESHNTEPKLSILTESQPKSQSPKVSRPEPSTVLNLAPSSSTMKHPTDLKPAPPPSQQEDCQGTIHFIPPPPEFANSDPEDETPPSAPPPDPPAKSVAQPIKSIPATNGPAAPPKPKSSQVPAPSLIQPKTLIQTQTLTPAPPKTQIPAPPPSQPPAPPPSQPPAPLPAQPKTQVPAPPTTQAPAPPSIQLKPLIPAPPPTQAPAPPSTQPKTQIPAPPPTQAPAPPPAQLKNKIPAPPPTQAPAPPPTLPKTQLPAPPITQLKTQLSAQPPTLPKTQPPVPPPIQLKTQLPAPPPVQPKTQTQVPPPTQPKTQIPTQPPPSVSASQATLLSILQKKMLEMDPKFAPVRETDSSGDDWNSPLSDDDQATSPPPNTTAKPKSATLPMQTQGLDMKELESKAAKKAQDLATKAPRNGPNSKQQYGMTFTVRPGAKQPITPVLKTD